MSEIKVKIKTVLKDEEHYILTHTDGGTVFQADSLFRRTYDGWKEVVKVVYNRRVDFVMFDDFIISYDPEVEAYRILDFDSHDLLAEVYIDVEEQGEE